MSLSAGDERGESMNDRMNYWTMTIRTMNLALRKSLVTWFLVLVAAAIVVPSAGATLTGTLPLSPGGSVVPGLVPPGTDPGTLLATLNAPFSSGSISGTVIAAVYRPGTTLDFYYQFTNGNSPNCGLPGTPACVGIDAVEALNFIGSQTSVGYRTDGGIFSPSPFVNGTVAPTTGDRNALGDVVGFRFPAPLEVMPGETSFVLVISTDATNFTIGNFSVLDDGGGTTTVASFAPVAPVPEPSSLLLLGSGLLAAGSGLRRKLRR